MEHNEPLTKAALVVLEELKAERDKMNRLASAPKTDKEWKAEMDQEEWVTASWTLKQNLLNKSIEDLTEQIITGKFDY